MRPADATSTSVLWGYVASALRHRRAIATGTLVFAGFLAALALTRSREYAASAIFLPSDPVGQVSGFGALAAQFGVGGVTNSGNSAAFYVELLKSQGVTRAVVRSQYTTGGFSGNLYRYYGLADSTSNHAAIKAVSKLIENTSVRQDRISGIVRIVFRSKDPHLSVAVVRRYLDLVNDFNLRRRQSVARAERSFVEGRSAAARDSLRNAEDALAAFLQRNRQYQDAPELVAVFARRQRSVTLYHEVYLSLAQRLESVRLEEVRNTPVVTVVDGPEGTIVPIPRGVGKSLVLGAFIGLVLGLIVASLVDSARAAGAYEDVVALRGEMMADFRRVVRPWSWGRARTDG